MKALPSDCPSCAAPLAVTQLHCENCETEVSGTYPLPPISRLEAVDQDFVLQFVRASGSLKEMAKLLGVSYPTVRNRLNAIIRQLESESEEPGTP